MGKFVINYSYSRNLPIPIDEDAVKKHIMKLLNM